jgi:signal transduction histidine kinase
MDLYEAAAEARDQRIEAELGPVAAIANEPLLQRLVANLLDNALKFSPDGAKVALACGREGPSGFLRISDNGPGLPIEERERVFEIGRRGSGSDSVIGTGFGLYLVGEIASRHGFAISLRDNAPGLVVEFRFKPVESSN